jgi:hypothetical protein
MQLNNKNNSCLVLPIYWTQEFKRKPAKTVLLGMNWYRNAHYHSQHSVKQHYHKLVEEQITMFSTYNTFKLSFELFYKSSVCDGANIIALVEKFTLDALQENNIIANDNVKYHLGSTWAIAGQDKENPRCIVNVISAT